MTPRTLAELEARLADDLLMLGGPPKEWVRPRQADGQAVLDVAVIGAGISGLIALAALKSHGIANVRAFDRAPAGTEGPWITYARMKTLRTAKDLPGLSLGIPSLTFRAWFEACFGRDVFEDMDLIPNGVWMDYLVWYRAVLGLDVVNEATVTRTAPRADGLFDIAYDLPDGPHVAIARRVVLATGLDGLGAPALPAIAHDLPPHLRAHGADMIDMARLKGKRVAVVGSGSSGMDNAASALEAGAESVDIFVRKPSLARVEKMAGIAGIGARYGFFDLPDAYKWRIIRTANRTQTPPPRHSVLRVSSHSNARFHLSSPILRLSHTGGAVQITTPKGRYDVDFMIFATGFGVDFARRPEFAPILDHVRLWRDAYTPPTDLHDEAMADAPYLGEGFRFLPKGSQDWVQHVRCFAGPSLLSYGKINTGIPSLNDGAKTLAIDIARSLFAQDRDAMMAGFDAFERAELSGDEWTDADAVEHSEHK